MLCKVNLLYVLIKKQIAFTQKNLLLKRTLREIKIEKMPLLELFLFTVWQHRVWADDDLSLAPRALFLTLGLTRKHETDILPSSQKPQFVKKLCIWIKYTHTTYSAHCWLLLSLILAQSSKNGKKWRNKELLDKWERGNEIPPSWHKCWAKRRTSTEGVQFYSPSSTYPAIVLLVLYFIA